MSLAPRSRLTLAVASMIGVSLAAAPFVALPAVANTAGTGVVINEAYLSGGSAGAAYANKFVELYNPTDAAVDLSAWSLQYRKATGTVADAPAAVALTGTIPAHGYYLVSGGSNGANGAALPTPDQTSTLNPSGTTGTLILAKSTSALSLPAGDAAGNPNVIDLLGYGASLTFEGAVAVAPSANSDVKSFNRSVGADSDSNAADFSLSATITPTNSTGVAPTPAPTATPTATPVPTPTSTDTPAPVDTVSINAIQGTTDVSPLAGSTVTTTGVVTAAFPTGGFKGFYLQTPGTGGLIDFGTHTASDGIFVYTNALTAPVAVGDYVSVKGLVGEFYNLTQLTVSALTDITVLNGAGITAPAPATVGLPATDSARESLEGMLIAPTGDFTVTNNYTTNQYGEIGLASGTTPLVGATVTARPGTAAYTQALASNAARAVTLDDGATTNYLSTANKSKPVPYLSTTNPVRIGAAVTFTRPVILDYRNNAWKFQPTTELVPANAATVQPATFADTRTDAPRNVGGDIRLGTFNVLNYFTTTGDELSGCTFYTDRAGAPTTVNSGCDARGAADQANLDRQQAKIVAAINALDAQVVSLEEIENSTVFGKDRDTALGDLVNALNADLGSAEWAFVPSPAAVPTDEDVIRTAFIYKKAAVETVGTSQILIGSAAFNNAREPLAQSFQLVGDAGSAFQVIVNHFKSKGSGTGADADTGDGQGASNASRVAQATALVAFADKLKTDNGIKRVFLTGDFNAYDQEDPIKVITDAGYLNQEAKSGEYTYAYGGTVGSLDHVFASPDANSAVTDVDVWNINSVESVALEYSRYNNNVTDFYAADAYRSSDHDPVVVGLDIASAPAVDINLLNINDFHGRIDANTVKFAGTIEQLRAEYGDAATLFLSDGDNIGASLFASSSQKDKPTIDVLNALGLDASAVGNHEFDQGLSDLTGRVSDAADFEYLGANVYETGTTTPALKEYQLFKIGEVTVGVIGAVTEETPTLVSPGGISTLSFGDPVVAVNRVAAQLTDGDPANGEADVLIAEYHEGAGAGTPDKATLEDELKLDAAFTDIVTKTSASVDAIFTGHTHKQYAWNAQVPDAAPGVTRPVLQTGSYGENIGQVVLSYDPNTGETTTVKNQNVKRTTAADTELVAAYPSVAAVKTITDAALAQAAVIGNQPVGSVTADISRACIGGTSPCAEDRAAASTLGTLVANSLRASLADPATGGAEIGIVNPGGLRADLLTAPDGVVTYAEANAVLPFLNNLWTTTLTGAQFKVALEQQWQTDAAGVVPSRPYLQLGLSDNVNYTFDASRAAGDRITGIWIDGAPINLDRAYRVGSFSFLLQGGDNFRELAKGTNTRDSGLVDRDAWISYITANSPLAPSYAARQASVTGVPTAAVKPGDSVTFSVSKLNLSSLGAPKNTTLGVTWGGSTTVFGPVAVDSAGAATVTVMVPADAKAASEITLTATQSGTVVRVPLTVTTSTTVPTTEPTPVPTTVPTTEPTPVPTTVPTTKPTAPQTLPTAAAEAALTALLKNKIRVSDSTVSAGDKITVEVGTAFAGQFVSVWVSSTPVNLGGWQEVSAAGTVTVSLPADLTAGIHRIIVQDASGAVIGWTEITVSAAGTTASGLAKTGLDATPWLAGGMLMLLLGAALMRRRRVSMES